MNDINNDNKKNNSYSFKIYEVIIMVAATCFLSFFAGSTIMELKMNRKYENNDSLKEAIKDESLRRFIDNYDYIVENYYKDIDKEELINGAIEGMMGTLDDPYTVYMDDDKYDRFNILLTGSYKGIGIELIQSTDNKLYIIGVIENSPAYKAGLMPGDIIVSLDGEDISNYSSKEFSDLISGEENKEFTITVERNNSLKEFTIAKEKVDLESVASKVYEQNGHKIGYIYISIFAVNTPTQFTNQLNELEKQEIDSLIIDVRSNNGGHLTSAEKISSLFVDSNHTIYKIKKNGKITAQKSKGTENKKYPIVVITNQYSASAAELLTGCLKDNLNATIVGKKTYGKGTVQELITLTNGDQYKITTKEWLTPNGIEVNGKGIKPDIEVEISEYYLRHPSDETDNQLKQAIDYLAK